MLPKMKMVFQLNQKNELSALNGSVVIKATYLNEDNEEEKSRRNKIKNNR